MSEAEPKDERGTWAKIAIGCGSLALLGLCVTPPMLWLAANADSGDDVAEGDPDPDAPVLSDPTPLPPLPPPQAGARRVSAVVEEVTGSVPGVRAGTRCEFDVTREDRDDGTFWCNAQIRCGNQLLYGGQTRGRRSGFFDCTLYEQPERHVVGEDRDTTGQDADPAMRLDTLRGTLTIRDDARGRLGEFTVRARVTGVS
jgi:hypothetical protein